MVARGAHLEAMRARGVRLIHGDEIISAKVRTDAVGVQDAVVVTLKANKIEPFADAAAPLLGPNLSGFAQNGIPCMVREDMESLDRAASSGTHGRRNVVGGVVYSATEVVEPGVSATSCPITYAGNRRRRQPRPSSRPGAAPSPREIGHVVAASRRHPPGRVGEAGAKPRQLQPVPAHRGLDLRGGRRPGVEEAERPDEGRGELDRRGAWHRHRTRAAAPERRPRLGRRRDKPSMLQDYERAVRWRSSRNSWRRSPSGARPVCRRPRST